VFVRVRNKSVCVCVSKRERERETSKGRRKLKVRRREKCKNLGDSDEWMTNFEEAVLAELPWLWIPRRRSDAIVVQRKRNQKAKERRKCAVLILFMLTKGTIPRPINVFFFFILNYVINYYCSVLLAKSARKLNKITVFLLILLI